MLGLRLVGSWIEHSCILDRNLHCIIWINTLYPPFTSSLEGETDTIPSKFAEPSCYATNNGKGGIVAKSVKDPRK